VRTPDQSALAVDATLDPVFVICCARSGSTLLRFLLDAHPELACPPETNLPALCAQLATVWSLIEGAPLSANRGDEPPEIPEAAVAGIRHMMDLMVGSYLERRGKRRYCDKSLGTARFADLLVRVYPRARFVCLYRHPMDLAASGMEACPWGLAGYGFDPYIAETPGNAVLALMRYWADHTAAVLSVQDKYPQQCHSVRYEDLVADPEQVAAGLFTFLRVAPAPGISSTCFSRERERFGPADHKIWCTSRITSESVGRGWSIPTAMIAPQVLKTVNELAGRLDYLPIDDAWGTTAPPPDLRAGPTAQTPHESPSPGGTVDHNAGDGPPGAGPRLAERLRAGLAAIDDDLTAEWGPHADETFVAVMAPGRTGEPVQYWLVDVKAGNVAAAGPEAQEQSDWDIVGSAESWERVTDGTLNMNVALKSCQLRYCDGNAAGPVAADVRLAILARLLDIAAW
jgi:protein-tyrosine sulfotransferase